MSRYIDFPTEIPYSAKDFVVTRAATSALRIDLAELGDNPKKRSAPARQGTSEDVHQIPGQHIFGVNTCCRELYERRNFVVEQNHYPLAENFGVEYF